MWSFGCIVSEIIQAVLKKDDTVWKQPKVLFPGRHCYSVSPKVSEDGEVVVDAQEQLIKILGVLKNEDLPNYNFANVTCYKFYKACKEVAKYNRE